MLESDLDVRDSTNNAGEEYNNNYDFRKLVSSSNYNPLLNLDDIGSKVKAS